MSSSKRKTRSKKRKWFAGERRAEGLRPFPGVTTIIKMVDEGWRGFNEKMNKKNKEKKELVPGSFPGGLHY